MTEDILNNENYYDDYVKTLKVNSAVSEQYEDTNGDVMAYNLKKMLNEMFLELFNQSPYYNKYKEPKKLDKCDIYSMFYYFKNLLAKENKFSAVDIFIVFAEFFDANYKVLYGELSVMDREILLRELSSTQCVKNKVKTVKLF